ncbi:hypothetical protein A7D16_16865 [Xanthomonas nasturtii]|nr:hypothetical protein A7D16_16865 [Xanthomonas nasturtii]
MPASDPARRRILQGLGAGLLLPATAGWPARHLAAPSGRPIITDGVQSGDGVDARAMMWSRADRPSRLRVEWDTRPSLRQARRVDGTMAGYQFFGEVEIDGGSGVLTVTLRDLDGVAQFRQPILPHGAA